MSVKTSDDQKYIVQAVRWGSLFLRDWIGKVSSFLDEVWKFFWSEVEQGMQINLKVAGARFVSG